MPCHASKNANKDKQAAFINHLDLDGSLKSLALLLGSGVGLGTHDTTTPVTLGLLVLVGVTVLDSLDELGHLGLVLGADLGESDNSSGLKH